MRIGQRGLVAVTLALLATSVWATSGAHATTSFQTVQPTRILDTRDGTGGVAVRPLRDREVVTLDVRGRSGIGPSDVAAVSLTVTVNRPVAAGFVTVYPCHQPRPLASNLNYRAGETRANAVLAPVSPQGTVCFYAERSTHLIVDVNGWFPAGTSGFGPLVPRRLFDTRDGTGGVPARPVATGETLAHTVTGRLGVPTTGVAAVSLNVTATRAPEPGFLTVHACSTSRPSTSSLNYVDANPVANAVIAPVGADGRVCFFAERQTHLIVDVNGWFSTGGAYTALRPDRLLDTRRTAMRLAQQTGEAPTPVPQVTNGNPIAIGDVPWQVRVTVNETVGCGGTLIHQRWVLTAAHCLVLDSGFVAGPSSVRVWAGQTRQSTMTLANSLAVIDVIVHPGFNRSTFANDVALLELVSPSTAGRPIELFADPGGPAALTPALLSGWGETVPGFPAPDQLHATWLYVRAGPTGPCGQWGASYQAAIMLCASGGVSSPDGAGGCRGDSGGPLVVTVSGRPLLAGVVSYGAGGCPNTHSAPTVFARVSSFVSWIRQYAPPAGTLADDVVEVQVTGRPGVPSSGVGAVVVNLTSTGTLSRGFLTAFPCGEVPGVSSLNTVPGRAVASMAVVPVSPAGSICVYSPTATHVIVDLLGWLPG